MFFVQVFPKCAHTIQVIFFLKEPVLVPIVLNLI